MANNSNNNNSKHTGGGDRKDKPAGDSKPGPNHAGKRNISPKGGKRQPSPAGGAAGGRVPADVSARMNGMKLGDEASKTQGGGASNNAKQHNSPGMGKKVYQYVRVCMHMYVCVYMMCVGVVYCVCVYIKTGKCLPSPLSLCI